MIQQNDDKIEFMRLLEVVLLLFDKVSDGKLLLTYGFSYQEIQKAKKALEVLRG